MSVRIIGRDKLATLGKQMRSTFEKRLFSDKQYEEFKEIARLRIESKQDVNCYDGSIEVEKIQELLTNVNIANQKSYNERYNHSIQRDLDIEKISFIESNIHDMSRKELKHTLFMMDYNTYQNNDHLSKEDRKIIDRWYKLASDDLINQIFHSFTNPYHGKLKTLEESKRSLMEINGRFNDEKTEKNKVAIQAYEDAQTMIKEVLELPYYA